MCLRRRREGKVGAALAALLLFALFASLVAQGQDYWPAPSCYTEGCTASNLKVDGARIWNASACSGGQRTADVQIHLDGNSIYNVRVHGEVHDSTGALKETIDWCTNQWTTTAWQTVASVTWDCDRSLYVSKILIAWEGPSGPSTCVPAVVPLCADIDPMCNNQAATAFDVSGSEPTNTPPTGSDSSVATSEDTTHVFLVGDFGYSDADSDPLAQIRITFLESVGDLKLSSADVALNQVVLASQISGGNLTYHPLPGESGTPYDTFRFEVHDGTEYSPSDYQMTINVSPVNDPPIAVDDTASTLRGASVLIPVLANDSDPDGGALELVSVTSASDGRAEIAGDEIRYSPDLFYIGSDTFAYTVRDATSLTASATVTVDVEDPNHPPTADANGLYSGLVGDPILLDARFSHDSDVTDILQYRWDTNADGIWDTDWLNAATYEAVFDRPYRGLIYVEVRDLYLGRPNRTSDQASAFALIEPRPTQLAISVYVDLNADGEFNEGDVGLPGVSLLLDGEVELFTEADGTAIRDDVAPGTHTIQISEAGIAYLETYGFFLTEDTLASIELRAGEWVALFFTPEARGFLEVDLGADDKASDEDAD
jgi:hypothetical protein